MATVQRANVYLDIQDDLVDYYVSIGYNVIDDKGNVLVATVPNDILTLQNAYRTHTQRIKELEMRIQELEKQCSKNVKTSVQNEDCATSDELIEKRKRTRKTIEKVEE